MLTDIGYLCQLSSPFGFERKLKSVSLLVYSLFKRRRVYMDIELVGIVGCGTMGSGIAEVVARSGYEVIVSEINDELLRKGMERIRKSMERGVEKKKIEKEEMERALSKIRGTTSIEEFSDCNLVIEAVVEDMNEKKKVFEKLDGIVRSESILATNTSSLSITEIASSTKRPEKVIGLHFYNPAPVMKLLEIIRGELTSDETFEVCKRFGESLGKIVVVARDEPGFIVNRLLIPYLLEAMRAYQMGVAKKEDIDQAMVLGCGHPMGPLALADLIGLDTVYRIAEAIYNELKDPKFAPPSILKRMVKAGYLGKKTGRGFYSYESK